MRFNLLVAVAAISLLGSGLAQAETLTFKATLVGADEVPPTDSAGAGAVKATLDTASKTLTYVATFSDLTGPAIAAHFHGPAASGTNAPPVIMMTSLTSPIMGEATLTDAQIADLEAGKWYFNVHTAAHKSGEIRGQLAPAN
jgi:hypothetical protein